MGGPGSLSFFLIATVVLALIGSTYAEEENVAVGFGSYKSENKMASEKTEVLPAAETAETAAERFLTGEGEGAGDTTAAPVKAASAAHDKSPGALKLFAMATAVTWVAKVLAVP